MPRRRLTTQDLRIMAIAMPTAYVIVITLDLWHFHVITNSFYLMTMITLCVITPLFFVALVTGHLRIPFIYLPRNRFRFPANQCQHCGYDIRKSKTRCPECGTPFHRRGLALPDWVNKKR